jgi:hypothetical protein
MTVFRARTAVFSERTGTLINIWSEIPSDAFGAGFGCPFDFGTGFLAWILLIQRQQIPTAVGSTTTVYLPGSSLAVFFHLRHFSNVV